MPSADAPAAEAHLQDYTTFDGQRLVFRRWEAHGPRTATLVYVHGIESHGGWFDATAKLLAAQGIEVLAPDRRGSGLNWLGRGHCRAYEHLLTDLQVFLRQTGADTPVHLLGLSWGAKVCFLFAQHWPELLASLILVTPGVWPRETLPPRDQVRVLWRWLRNRQSRMPVPLTVDMFSDRPEARHWIETDGQRLVAVTPSLLWESRRMDRLVQPATWCPVPLLAVLSAADRIIDTPRTELWLNALRAPERRMLVYDRGHALQLECPDVLADDLVRWMAGIGD